MLPKKEAAKKEPWEGSAGAEAGPSASTGPEGATTEDPTTLAEVAETAGNVVETEITETLKVPLTDEQYKDFAIKMARANCEIGQAEDDFSSVKAQFKSRIEAATAERNRFAAILNAGCEYKPVECKLVKDYGEKTITVIRMDTQEVVSTRTMSADELQRGLFDLQKGERGEESPEAPEAKEPGENEQGDQNG